MAESKKVKVWRVSPDAEAHMRIEEDSVYLAGSTSSFLAVDGGGVTIRGNMSIANMGPGRRVGGFFVNQLEFADMIPKTIVTPIPAKLPFPPLGFLSTIIQGVTFGMAFLMG